jgi:hypothetical protein
MNKTEQYYNMFMSNTRWGNRGESHRAFEKMTIHASNLETALTKAIETNQKLDKLLGMYKNQLENIVG